MPAQTRGQANSSTNEPQRLTDVLSLDAGTHEDTARNLADAINSLDGFRARIRTDYINHPDDGPLLSAYVIVTLPKHRRDDLQAIADQVTDELDYIRFIDVPEYDPDGAWPDSVASNLHTAHDLRQAVLTPGVYSGYGDRDDKRSSWVWTYDPL
jgi:hypothetical protein